MKRLLIGLAGVLLAACGGQAVETQIYAQGTPHTITVNVNSATQDVHRDMSVGYADATGNDAQDKRDADRDRELSAARQGMMQAANCPEGYIAVMSSIKFDEVMTEELETPTYYFYKGDPDDPDDPASWSSWANMRVTVTGSIDCEKF